MKIRPWDVAEATEAGQTEFRTFLRLCAEDKQLLAEYDRLRGTDLSRRATLIEQLIDDATGSFETAARGFYEFVRDVLYPSYLRMAR
jgi:hypothetical protein